MAVWTLGINHHSAPLDLRGRFAYALDQLAPALSELRQRLAVAARGDEDQIETAILSTCNRTEIYCAAPRALPCASLEWLARSGGMSATELSTYAYTHDGDLAARHAFRVASGLDSMVLGEAQILGQMKNAVRAAEQAGALGATLHQLFQRSFAVAKEVRSSTAIGEHSISMAAAAVRLAGQLFEDFTQLKVLFVGAGEMIELVATHFAAQHPQAMAVANRTLERGEKLAARLGAHTLRIGELPDSLHEFDVIVSCTASSVPIIGLGAVERALKRRRNKPMFMVDLAVPRDIEPEVQQQENVYLYTVDDLAGVVQAGKAHRQAAIAQAEAIIDNGVQGFARWLELRQSDRAVVPLIQQLHQQAQSWNEQEVARARKMLARGQDVDAVLQALADSVARKMLHGAVTELRNGDAQDRQQTAEMVSRLFLRNHATPAQALDAPKAPVTSLRH
ncbi:glutamyl-tRNA reductase [Allofranklinella schreckenbergeri]|uniref:Glutamyl-tRNA reductase n=1 Tax=Allofranklinella schreckenbergeri TaxID=1076744 RepID=A0A3M6R9I5_9BURK|nr:glutamyl-tRNA reductase [Allofranklinella schreckenbergeri]MDO4705856.1 glutamyl-tRNA reductase [Comamonadaceae bacterium]RMX11550.1 glutamyl-tRNA reductase [Allofranklinella schreckenbergeri]